MRQSLISNPPYNMKWKHPELINMLPQYIGWHNPPESNANFAFILTALSMITDTAVFLLPCGVLAASNKAEQAIKKELIDENLLDAVITLPDGMFESTGIPTCILVFRKNRKTRTVEMIDMRETYKVERRDQRGQYGGAAHEGRTYHKDVKVFSDEQINKAVQAVNERTAESGFSASVQYNDIKSQDYVITPSRYIAQEQKIPTHRVFCDIANDYNRIIEKKNQIKLTVNETAAKRLNIPVEMYRQKSETELKVAESFRVAGCEVQTENYMHFTKNAIIRIEVKTKDGIPMIIQDFLRDWSLFERMLNDEENRILAEFRDALLPELMSGKVKV